MVLLGLHLLLMTPVFAFQYFFVIESQRLFWGVISGGGLGFINLLQLRRWGNERFVCHIGCAVLTLMLLWLCLHTVAITSPVLPWLILVPLVALGFLGRVSGAVVWALLSLAAMGLLLFVPEMGWDIRSELAAEDHHRMIWLSAAVLMGSIMAIVAARGEMEHWLLRTSLKAKVERELHTRMAAMDRVITMGTLAAGVGHEINNPLAFVRSNMDFIIKRRESDSIDDALLDECLLDIQVGTRRVQYIVEELQLLSRKRPGVFTEVDVKSVVESAVTMVRHRIEERATLVCKFAELPRVQADENGLAQILLNLLINAEQSIVSGDSQENNITVTAGVEEGNITIEVRDTGEGMSEEPQSRIFEAFYTTKGVAEGTGLGLAICQNIARAMRGRIEVESVLGEGTTMRLVWPGLMAESEVLV